MKNWQSLLWLGFGATTAIILSSTLYCYRSKQCCNAKAKQRKRVRRRPRVVFFGDSITERGWDVDYSGWLANLGHWWSRRLDVVNRGLSGYNTTWSRQIIDQWILDEPIDFLFLFFGENDGVTVTSSQQHVPLEEYRDNLHFIISRVRMIYPKIPIVLITPSPIWENGLKFDSVGCNEVAKTYGQVAKDVATQWSLSIVDAWSALEGESEKRQHYVKDGVHYNCNGNIAIFRAVKAIIEERFPEWLPETIHMDDPINDLH